MNNIGCMSQKQIMMFAKNVLRGEFPGWRMKWTRGGGICIRKSKIIYIDDSYIDKYPWVAKGAL